MERSISGSLPPGRGVLEIDFAVKTETLCAPAYRETSDVERERLAILRTSTQVDGRF